MQSESETNIEYYYNGQDIGTEREGAIRLVLLSLQVLEKSLKKGVCVCVTLKLVIEK